MVRAMAADIAEDFAHRASLVRAQDEERLAWMNDFHAQLAELSHKYKDCCADLERERIAGRETQKRAAVWERQFQNLKQSVDESSFVLVLIDADADAYLFKEEYYSGSDGGQKAARDLQARVKDYLKTAKPELAGLPIVIKAFVNGDGTSKFLSNVGVVQPSSSLWDFGMGFSQAHAASDFVFVGNGKDRADKKIKSVFEQFVRNPTCRHIMFGACHDNGYVRMLEDFAEDKAIVERVTLLYSFSVGKEFRKLPFRATTLDTIFRTATPDAATTGTPVHHQGTTPGTENTHTTTPKTWATLAKSENNSSQNPVSIQPTPPFGSTVLVNAAGHRVDQPLAQPSKTAINTWNHKIKKVKMRYCRVFQLDGKCQGGCGYSHGPLSDAEKLVLRTSLRNEGCHARLKCREKSCHYRHNCACTNAACKFPREMHGVDETTAMFWKG